MYAYDIHTGFSIILFLSQYTSFFYVALRATLIGLSFRI
jgi:hypothetical protein